MSTDLPVPGQFDSAIDDEVRRLRIIYASDLPDKVAQLRSLVADMQENKANLSPVNEIFRAAHSMKGAASMYGFQTLADLGAALDEVLYPLLKGAKPVTDGICDLCVEWLTAISDVAASSEKGVERSAADYAVFHRLQKLSQLENDRMDDRGKNCRPGRPDPA
ncbi:MAG: hypothetical protein A3G34_07015 [Candidatus Lindowbacteria bacterium RIFCSPLOWO2_12_FULL_62_27]|nr:MAG: hypothetical protein A3G34_07015 [Candidatus Lindowbacteria bacterium RIFCSPLOWO2_12_FULL_62_27]OGH61293.1 MAG: hypothetical protein A3I06_03420 [Candidatus Lindowbacteria bacterium RIFCSPLOWO2_02_FULL_62_12]